MSAALGLRANVRARLGTLALDVELETGEGPLVVIGPNGAGKSSLLRLLLGLLPNAEGRIDVGETSLLDSECGIDVPVERRRLGYLPQNYALFPHLRVRENIAFAVRHAKREPGERRAEAALVDHALNEFGVLALAERDVRALSGGEKQRVALARAMAVTPRALLLDEPLAALDVHARHEVRAVLAATLRRLALPTVIVTHDPHDARELGGRIAVLEAGRIARTDGWAELVARPVSPFVEEFVATR